MISVVIPVYNPGDRFRSLLDCVLDQSEKDFEVILIDDGSSDGSGDICDKYTFKDSRFRVIHQVNSGVSAARNKGIAEAKGDYITFLDADDEVPSNYFKVLLETQRETSADIVCCDVVIIRDGDEYVRFTHEPSVLNQYQAMNMLLSRRWINSGPYAKLFCINVLHQVEFPDVNVYEDILFVRDTFAQANQIAVTNESEYRYFQNDNSAMQKSHERPSIDIIKATDNICDYIIKHPELDSSCFYTTISHMMQYVFSLRDRSEMEGNSMFIKDARRLLRKYRINLIKCNKFPWKEKVLFLIFAFSGYYPFK